MVHLFVPLFCGRLGRVNFLDKKNGIIKDPYKIKDLLHNNFLLARSICGLYLPSSSCC